MHPYLTQSPPLSCLLYVVMCMHVFLCAEARCVICLIKFCKAPRPVALPHAPTEPVNLRLARLAFQYHQLLQDCHTTAVIVEEHHLVNVPAGLLRKGPEG